MGNWDKSTIVLAFLVSDIVRTFDNHAFQFHHCFVFP